MADRLLGLVLFLPVPFVLWLFTRMPLGVGPSLALGIVVMLTHRLYARPYALSRKMRRCLWCGAQAGDGPGLQLVEPQGPATYRACCGRHELRLRRFLGWADRHRLLLRLGILGGLLALVLLAALAEWSPLPIDVADAASAFKLAVVAAVLPLGVIGPHTSRRAEGVVHVPFPVHIQALIGTWSVAWLFRIVGVVWLVQVLGLYSSAVR